jgi:hypothetical protein
MDAEQVGHDRGRESRSELQQRCVPGVAAVNANALHAATEHLLTDRSARRAAREYPPWPPNRWRWLLRDVGDQLAEIVGDRLGHAHRGVTEPDRDGLSVERDVGGGEARDAADRLREHGDQDARDAVARR